MDGLTTGAAPKEFLRAATWNVNWWNRDPRELDPLAFIGRYQPAVCLLQEVRGKALRDGHRGPAVFSHEAYAPANWNWMGCAILLAPGTAVLDHGVIESLPKPQRGLWARVTLPSGLGLTAVAWHAPNRAGDGLDVKMAAFAAVADWLAGVTGPVVLGADLNTWTDPVDLMVPESGDEHWEEHAFVGPEPRHGLVDAYRTVLHDSGALDERRATQDPGPLAVSHVLSNGHGHRMDRIFASPDLSPVSGGYELSGAMEAGSDHALHWIDFQVP
jgi:exonuclease III